LGFQQPPVLPDYQKLKIILTNSGVQKWNPPVYDILSRLIDAVSQSQDVITSPANTDIIVDPNGAILGDGTTSGPLRVSVDGVTITIVGDQLVGAAGSGIPVQEVLVTLNTAQLLTLSSVPIQVLPPPGSAGFWYQILWMKSHFNGDPGTPQEFQFSQNAQLLYGNGTFGVNQITNLVGMTVAHSQLDQWGEGTIAGSIYTVASNVPDNASIYIRASVDNALALVGGSNISVGLSIGYVIRSNI